MTKTAVFSGMMGLLLIALGVLLVFSVSAHLNPQIRDIRQEIERQAKIPGTCGSPSPISIYYSEQIGTIMVLAKLPSGQTAGTVLRVSTHVGAALLPAERVYETACLVTNQAYWCRRIVEYNYVDLGLVAGLPTIGFGLVLLAASKHFSRMGLGAVSQKVWDEYDKRMREARHGYDQ